MLRAFSICSRQEQACAGVRVGKDEACSSPQLVCSRDTVNCLVGVGSGVTTSKFTYLDSKSETWSCVTFWIAAVAQCYKDSTRGP